MAEIISFNAETLIAACDDRVIKDPTDNLILATILSDVANHTSAQRAFFTTNVRDFGGNRFVQERLKTANLKFFGRSGDLLNWVGSLGTA